MNFAGLFFLLVTQFLAGRGLLALFNIRQRPLPLFSISMICGILVFSLIPMVLEMAHIPITSANTAIAICITSAALFLPRARKYDYTIFKKLRFKKLPLYEWFFIIVNSCLMIPSLWRCYYYPVFSRDILSGAEPIAEYTIREHKMMNSVFKVSLESTNNHLKPPFVADLQILYKMFVHPFGAVWLSILVVCFLIWLYQFLKDRLHPFITGMLMLLFITMPDPYGYTYIVLYDYSNMVFVFMGVYFISEYTRVKQYSYFMFACLMFGFATSIRLETLVLIGMGLPFVWYLLWKEKIGNAKALVGTIVFIVLPFIFYYIWVGIFIKYYFPVTFNVDTQLNVSFSKINIFYQRFADMNTGLLFGRYNISLFGYFINIFAVLLIADAILVRKFNKEARIALCAMLILWVGIPFLGFLIPWYDLANTTKRGLYKLLPLMLLYMRNNGLLLRWSEALKRFEFPGGAVSLAKAGKPVVSKKRKK